MPSGTPTEGELDLSIVAPAHNEQDNVHTLVEEIDRAIFGKGLSYEVLIVDDRSTDLTRDAVRDLMPDRPWLRCVALTAAPDASRSGAPRTRPQPPGRGNGQSAAFAAGFRAARGRLIATLDADLQNDPADIPGMLDLLRSSGADMVQGDRSLARRDTPERRYGSIVGRAVRKWILGDTIRDTGCSLRVMKHEVALALPLDFRGMHRFIPVTARHLGYTVIETPVNHRARSAGATKYGAGLSRAIPGLIDCLAVRWMRSRRCSVAAEEVRP